MLRVHDTTTRPLRWRTARPGLWIASRSDGEAAGMVVERWAEGFHALASNGRDVGTFPTAERAQNALQVADDLLNARRAKAR